MAMSVSLSTHLPQLLSLTTILLHCRHVMLPVINTPLLLPSCDVAAVINNHPRALSCDAVCHSSTTIFLHCHVMLPTVTGASASLGRVSGVAARF
jgi:hypothetical protein